MFEKNEPTFVKPACDILNLSRNNAKTLYLGNLQPQVDKLYTPVDRMQPVVLLKLRHEKRAML